MSLKRRIKLITLIEQRAILDSKTYEDGEEVKIINFPLNWWNQLKEECMK